MSTDPNTTTPSKDNDPSLETSNYEVIRKRLVEQGRSLAKKADGLNTRRQEFFGSTSMEVIGNQTITTENNCIPQDIINLGDQLLFGYNVRRKMSATQMSDVFSLHAFSRQGDEIILQHVAQDTKSNFLGQKSFQESFEQLYFSFKDASLRQLRRVDGRLLAIFQTGTSLTDIKVFRWAVDAHNKIDYIDNAGEKDNTYMPTHDFEWNPSKREDQITGKHPHISIQNKVFVETVGGDLNIKVEDNTDDGVGIYSEPVDDKNQSLGDAKIEWAEVGNLILIKVQPYREKAWRYFVFNTLTRSVTRVDSIGLSCVALPEDHGIIFPGGYVLESGEVKTFDTDTSKMRIERVQRSPNGEDVLYAFYRPDDGLYFLLSYNLIRKEVQNPIQCHGYSVFGNGTMIIFRTTDDQQTRHHPMQMWHTPYVSDEFAAAAPTDGSFLSKVGNADLVRGISDAYTIRKVINNQQPTVELYASIISAAERMLDQYYWFGDGEVDDMASSLREVIKTSQLVIDEFQKVRIMQQQALEALNSAEDEQKRLFSDIRYGNWREISRFVDGLDGLRSQRGRLITLREVKYMDLERVDALEQDVIEQYDRISQATVSFLLGEDALTSYQESIQKVITDVETISSTMEAKETKLEIDRIGEGLNLLTEVISGLKIEDPTARTKILEAIAEVLGQQNRSRAMLEARQRSLLESEGKAEFAVQFQLLGQSVTSALGMCESPEKCDEQLERMMVQLQEMESRFSEFDLFLVKLTEKREEIYEIFETRKQQLVESRQRKASTLSQAAEKIISGITRRAQKMDDVEKLNAYFAADAMVLKVREMADQLRDLKEPVKADDLANQLKATRDQAIRSLRDKLDLFEDGDSIIKFGKHRFSINTQPLELTMVPRDKEVRLHITGSDFYEPVTDADFLATRYLWSQQLVSETPEVYRCEYLAMCILNAASEGENGLNINELHQIALNDNELLKVVRSFIEERYDEGYERGVHDTDTTLILTGLVNLYHTSGLLRYRGLSRSLATLYWAYPPEENVVDAQAAKTLSLAAQKSAKESPAQRRRKLLVRRATSLGRLRKTFTSSGAAESLIEEIQQELQRFCELHDLDHIFADYIVREAAEYLIEELSSGANPRFVLGAQAENLATKFNDFLDTTGNNQGFEEDLSTLSGELMASWELAMGWLQAYISQRRSDEAPVTHLADEAVGLILTRSLLDHEVSSARIETSVKELLGQHSRIDNQVMTIKLDEFLSRLNHFIFERVPAYRAYRTMSHEVLDRARKRLKLEALKPKVLSTFVRNKLIDEVYLPLIGDNLAKQMGSAGDSGRSDRQGLLLLISPPGYGKTTLMEYVANRLGLTFMKINGPALGHNVISIDPAEAPNATARQEVEKINLALRMGNNVMLYLDDIQHCNPELLQKFISLCDATRRIEGVWEGDTTTYDLRGKRFSVVMAGNPYTETGDRFQIPDMLANRADTYNLGDILEGSQDAFSLSYIENALTANPVLAPLSNREKDDIYLFIRMAQGEDIALTDLKYSYSSVEANEIVNVLKKLFVCQEVLLQVNQAYIDSASQDDDYRTEPPFKLQGSYRNMTKLAEKIVSAMNDEELSALIDDHYLGESQTLTTAAEQNLLRLKELRGNMNEEDHARLEGIRTEFRRRKMMGGGGDNDPVSRVAGPLSSLVQGVEELRGAMQNQSGLNTPLNDIRDAISAAMQSLQQEGIKAQEQDERANQGGMSAEAMQQMVMAMQQLATAQQAPAAAQLPAPEVNVHSDTAHIEALLQRQTLMFEGVLNNLSTLADHQLQANKQGAEALQSIEKTLSQGSPLRMPPMSAAPVQYVAVQGAPAQGVAPAATQGTAPAQGFVAGERPLTGVKKRVPFKQVQQSQGQGALQTGEGRTEDDDEAYDAPATQKMAAVPTEPDAPATQKMPAVKLEPPFE